MPEFEISQSGWKKLIAERRPIWEEWNKVMDRLTLAFTGSGIPSEEDLDLEEKIKKQLDGVEARMTEFRSNLLRQQS